MSQTIEPRCLCCKSSKRALIDQLLVAGYSYTAIEEQLAGLEDHHIDRKSISNHAKKHLTLHDAAIRRVIERQAEENFLDIENAADLIITKEAYLQLMIQKGFDALASDTVPVNPREVTRSIELLDKLEKEKTPHIYDHFQRQVDALTQAVKEIVPQEYYGRVIDRYKEIIGSVTIEGSVSDEPAELQSRTDP
jgi:hypothetical protein